MSAFEIPLTPQPQAFLINLLGTDYRLAVNWCGPHNAWTLDVMDAESVPIVMGIPLVTGVDLFAQFKYLGLPGSLFVQSLDDVDTPPVFDNLGTGALLFLVTEDD